jgi:hypothetical protein
MVNAIFVLQDTTEILLEYADFTKQLIAIYAPTFKCLKVLLGTRPRPLEHFYFPNFRLDWDLGLQIRVSDSGVGFGCHSGSRLS